MNDLKITGISLIEVLISLMLISILLLGVDAAQVISLRQSRVNYYFSIAQQQINNMKEHLQISGNDSDISTWNKQNSEMLPLGRGVVHENKIAILWGKNAAENCETNVIETEGCLQIHLS